MRRKSRTPRFSAPAALLLLLASCRGGERPPAPSAATATTVAATWSDLLPSRSPETIATTAPGFAVANFGGGGPIEERADGVRLPFGSPLTGITWPVGSSAVMTPPDDDYEIEVEAARLGGTDFFCALTFPVGAARLTLVLGGWGGATCGFSCLDGRDAASNATTCYRRFEKGRFYTARVRVSANRVEAFLDGEPLCATPRDGVVFSLRPEVEPCGRLGVASYATTSHLRAVRWRPLTPARGG